jgi:2-iminobutanoate/2-iminopropanoate deaminase
MNVNSLPRAIALALVLTLASQAHAQRGPTPRRAIVPENTPNSGLPYSPGILVGNALYISGQLGRTGASQLAPGGIEGETRQIFVNVRKLLETAGMDLASVVSVTVYIASLDDFAKFNAVYKDYFPKDPPARSTVQVAALNLGARVEISMIAVK